MADQDSRLTRSQIDKLGERLKTQETPADEDRELLALYQASLRPLQLETMAIIREAFIRTFPDRTYEPTERDKQVRSVVAKLRRQPIKLSRIQDLVGFRIVVPRVVDQDDLLRSLPLDETWRLVDRRQAPSNGYRAVHLVRKGVIGAVEVQIRTTLQQLWAEASELWDRAYPGTKYGVSHPAVLAALSAMSRVIVHIEAIELDFGDDEVLESRASDLSADIARTLRAFISLAPERPAE